jgi:hypothetical protein
MRRIVMVAVAALAAGALVPACAGKKADVLATFTPYSEDALREARSNGQAVVILATADW